MKKIKENVKQFLVIYEPAEYILPIVSAIIGTVITHFILRALGF